MSTNLSVIKNPFNRTSGGWSEARRETQQTPDRNSEHCRARRCRHRPDYAGAAGPPARSGSLERRHRPLWHSAGAVCVDAFACAPVLGALSDRFGRRPVLLVSLAGAAVDYAIMATAPFLWVLYIGRIVAGITGATGAVAGAYIADITDGDERARHFGFMSACSARDGRGTCARWADGRFLPHAPFFAAQP